MRSRLWPPTLLAALLVGAALAAAEAPAILEEPELPARHARLAAALVASDGEGRRAWIDRIDAAPPCAARDEDRRLAVELWAVADQKSARDYVERFPGGPRRAGALREAFVRGWVRGAPELAWQWAGAQPGGEHADLPRAALETIAEVAPETGLGWLRAERAAAKTNEAAGSAHEEHAFAFFRRLAEVGDYAACQRWLEAYPASETREQLLYFVSDRMAAHAWAEAARWAETRRREPDAFYSAAPVALQRGRSDWRAALAWIEQAQEDATRPQLVRVVAGDTIERGPQLGQAEEILSRLERPAERQAAFAAFASCGELVRIAPQPVLDWAWQIEVRNERRMALIRGYGHWFAFDRAAAMRHLEAEGAKIPEDAAGVRRFLEESGEP